MKVLITTVFLCASLAAASAQAPPAKPASQPTPAVKKASTIAGRSECAVAVGLCVTVPSGWQRLGDVFEDLGFVVAEPHSGADSATWPQLTVAAIDVPPEKDPNGAAAAPSLDALVDIVITPDSSSASAETLQRTRLLLNGHNAEIVRVRLRDASNSETVEAVALIEGDDGLVYSIALRCAPQDFARLEPAFQKVIHSWRIKQAAQPTPHSKPKQDSEKK